MDIAQQLIRSMMRAFYATKQILVIDALLVHSTLNVEDLAHVLAMTPKDLRKLCQPLREDKLVSVHTRPETRPGQQRPTNRDYYFVNYHMAIDAIKYRIVKLQQMVQDLYKPTQERKEYNCDRCKAEWTQMDVLAHVDFNTGEFLCPNCGFVLERHEISAEDAAGSARTSKLNDQLKPLVSLLQQIDATEIPANEFEEAHERHKAIERSELNPAVEWRAVQRDGANNTVRGMQMEALRVQVELTSAEETEKRAEEMKQKKAAQQAANQLPEWHTRSTVTGKSLSEQEADGNKGMSEKTGAGSAGVKEESKTDGEDENVFVNAYYEELRMEQEREAAKTAEEASSGDDDDDDGFEDVPAAAAIGTPVSMSSQNGGGGAGSKRHADDSGIDSGANTGVSTPAGFESPAKRVKIEERPGGEDDDEDEDDEDEDAGDFEDAL